MLNFSGILKMQTFRKLPITIPKRNTIVNTIGAYMKPPPFFVIPPYKAKPIDIAKLYMEEY
jgi:hypothetical protein